MFAKTRKLLISIFTAATLLMLSFALFSYARTDAGTSASAADSYQWAPSIKHRVIDEGNNLNNFVDIGTQTEVFASGDEIDFFVRIEDSQKLVNNGTFKYIKVRQKFTSEAEKNNADWITIIKDDNNRIDTVENGKNVTYFWADVEVDASFYGYVYFSLQYFDTVDGNLSKVTEYYPVALELNYTVSSSEAPEIKTVSAVMSNGSAYDGRWLATPLTFTVTTSVTQSTGAFDPRREILSYSFDNVNFSMFGDKNTVEIKNRSLNDTPVTFRITDVAGRNEQLYTYGSGQHENEYNLNMDPYAPEFSVSADTTDLVGNTIEYKNGTWTPNTVSFSIQNTGKCCSVITYSASIDGRDYTEIDLNQNTNNSWTLPSTNASTVSSVRFRATNQAGVTYEYGTAYTVKIDSEVPNVDLSASTTDPSDNSKTKQLIATPVQDELGNDTGTVSFGYANGLIRVYIFNRNVAGPIKNESGTVFKYQEKINGIYTGKWNRLESETTSSAGEKGYVLERKTTDVTCVSYTFKFMISSNAGRDSEEREVTFKILKSTYLIELGEINGVVNDDGWIIDYATVTVSVPTDSVRLADGTYSVPTMSYRFFYQASNSTVISSAAGRPDKVHEEKDGTVTWWYEFTLIASANSTFLIRAQNDAGQYSSGNPLTTDTIKIDVMPPEYTLSAYIHPTVGIPSSDFIYLDVDNPGWVNGQIILTLRVKVGVSGVYVKEMKPSTAENGELLRDELTGEIIWQPSSKEMSISETVDDKATGSVWQVYTVSINLNEGGTSKYFIGSREYRWRISTRGGKSIDATFTANIDTSDEISVTKFDISSGAKRLSVESSVEAGGSGQRRYIDLSQYDFSVCEATEIGFASSLDKQGVADHFKIKYGFFDGSGMTPDRMLEYAATMIDSSFTYIGAGMKLPVTIPSRSTDDIYIAIFIESNAINYLGESISAGPYIIKLHYDTVNLAISYELRADNTALDLAMQAGEWINGSISVTVKVKTNEYGGQKIDASYSFWYMEINSLIGGIPSTGWVRVDGGLLTENESSMDYEFTLPFTNRSYAGYIAVSVCNGAGYRSTQEAASVIAIKVDNTTPDIDEAIVYPSNITAAHTDGVRADRSSLMFGTDQVTVITYYAMGEIELQRVIDERRAPITFYYLPVFGIGTDTVKLTYKQSDLRNLGNTETPLFSEAGITLTSSNYQTVYYFIYASNSVGTEAFGATKQGGSQTDPEIKFSAIYKFIYDPSVIEGTISYDSNNGIYSEQTGMFTYLWKEEINIFVSGRGNYAPIGEEQYILYQFSVDGGTTWYDYLDFDQTSHWYNSGDDISMTFSPSLLRNYVIRNGNGQNVRPFENGVSCVFTIRARNKAGAVKIYDNVFIAMEDTVPQFTVKLLDHNNAAYYGGEADFNREPEKWSSGPITVNIETTVMPASGITFMYYIEYSNGSSTVSTAEPGTYGKKLTNYTSFSTDTLDGFNLNRDAILYITAFGNSSAENFTQVKVRIAVDQVVPEFTLTGQAFKQMSSVTELISSGQWTNKDTVTISKSTVATNVSKVEYRYTIKNRESTAAATTPLQWVDNVGSIDVYESCDFTVTATTKSGLTYTRTFVVNIDTTPPAILFDGGMNVIQGEEYFIDLRVYVEEANIEICEYITIKEESRGFAFNPDGYILSTSSVDNSTRYEKATGAPYRGYVKVYVKDYAGNEASIYFYVLPFRLTVNNLTLSDEDLAQVDAYEAALTKARPYMETSRIGYFENLISRLNDRENTLIKEIEGYKDYIAEVASRDSFELQSDYGEMYSYMETYNNYEIYGQKWIQDAIKGQPTDPSYANFRKFKEEFDRLSSLMDSVKDVEKHVTELPAINMVERKDYDDIMNVYYEFQNLNEDQQTCFTPNLKNKLLALKKGCEVLLLIDEDFGVSINGNFGPGAEIITTQFDSTTETFNNVQSLLASTVSADLPRTVVSVYRVALTDAYASTVVGDIEVTLPISEEYQNYITFSVYELSEDGSVKPIKNTEIQPDGTKICFRSDSLSTYVLCVKAEMGKTDTSEGTYGTLLGLELDTKMIKYLIYIGAALFGLILLVVIIGAIRQRRFLNSYNRAYRHSLYRRGVKGIPKGNKIK